MHDFVVGKEVFDRQEQQVLRSFHYTYYTVNRSILTNSTPNTDNHHSLSPNQLELGKVYIIQYTLRREYYAMLQFLSTVLTTDTLRRENLIVSLNPTCVFLPGCCVGETQNQMTYEQN